MTSTLRITRRAADRLRAGHLWVYRSDIEQPDETLTPGALVTVVDNRKIPLGTALYSSTSQIAARLISRTPALSREQYLVGLKDRVESALALRHELAPFTPENSARRLIFAEADNLPGIIADRYNDLILLQLLTQGTAQDDVRQIIVEALATQLAPGNEPLTIWERPDPRIRELEQLPAPAPGPLFTNASSPEAPTTTTFALNGLRFHYDASAGQKTGAFLDQRLNYEAAARHVLASGRKGRALDVCTYQGGFALHLAQVCREVTGIDTSHASLEVAERNLEANRTKLDAKVDWVEADAFEILRDWSDAKERFDTIVLDPPAFAKTKRAVEGALRGYKELNLRALRMVQPGGLLVTCSCSHHVGWSDLEGAVASAAADAHRRVRLLERRGAAPDHPVIMNLPETEYLKCLVLEVD